MGNKIAKGPLVKSAISLPCTPKSLPDHLQASTASDDIDASLLVAKDYLAKCEVPHVIACSYKTPVNWWIAAEQVFPDTKKIIYQKDDSWLWVDCNDALMGASEGTSGSSASLKKIRDSGLIWDTYRRFIFNEPDAELSYQRNLRLAESRSVDDPRLVGKIEESAQDGRMAQRMIREVKQKINRGETEGEVKSWIDCLPEELHPRVVDSIQKEMKRQYKYNNKKKAIALANVGFKVALPQISLQDGMHPQSLRRLAPSHRWEVYVDETGSIFTQAAQDLDETDRHLGRVIALACPENHGLAGLVPGTHATDFNHSQVQDLLKVLVEGNVGVLGATLKADIQSHSWIASIVKLVRWALMMLPVTGPTEVVFKIEQKGSYNKSSELKVLQDTLIDELRQLAPERFNTLQLSLEIATKEDPFIGYVDVIANCWGSNDRVKKQLLERTGWLGHCLMQSTHITEIERLYRRAVRGLDADSWFSVCKHVAKEGGHSLFNDLLKDLGEHARHDVSLWRTCLIESQRRIALKDFDAGSLERALGWLNRFKPHDVTLPGLLRLKLSSAQLAASNHLGQYDVSHLRRTLALVNELKDESAPDACEALLRLATSATNNFDFSTVVPYLEQWVEHPVATPGLLNHGKLHSALGQLCAFREERDEAIIYFNKAIACFEQLSDPELSNSNKRQTRIYKILVSLDLNAPKVADTVLNIVDDATKTKAAASIRKVARSGSAFRFEHYLLLRWLVTDSSQKTVRDYYLTSSEEWQVGEGHPWMLINAYRGWLLMESDRSDEAAGYFQKAVDDCSAHGESAILHWMASCIHALAESFGVRLEPSLQICPTEQFPSQNLDLLRDAGGTAERVAALNALLPFNFH